jgi:hypothetical protein
MQKVLVQWHPTPWTLFEIVPEAELRILFNTVGIDLQISKGEGIDFSPKSEAHFDQLEEQFRPTGNVPLVGHLFLSDTPISGRAGVLGEVCGRTHGLAVIYVKQLGRDNVKDSLLAVCAHEIGHMCNLTHNLAEDSPFDSVMTQSTFRDDPAQQAWVEAASEASKKGVPGAVFAKVQLDCLPFNHRCRTRLAPPVADWGPWTCSFGGHSRIDMEDRKKKTPALQMLIHPARTKCQVADPIAFDIELINKSKKNPVAVPLNLDCEFGHLEVTILTGATTRTYAPRTYSCCNDLHTITPGNSAFFPISMSADRFGNLIESPGKHTIRVELTTGTGKKLTALSGEFELTASASMTLSPKPAKPPRAIIHSTILARATSMQTSTLSRFVQEMARQYRQPEDAALHLHLRKRLELHERRK